MTITSPGNGASFRRGSMITVRANVTDNVGVKEVTFDLNGQLRCVMSPATSYSCQIQLPNTRGWSGTGLVQSSDAAVNVGRASIRITTY